MMTGNCCSKKICPVSFGLALGLTLALGYLFWALWVIFYGPSAMMVAAHMPVPTLTVGLISAFWALVKGFIFGFFVALFYDLISCCCKSKWCCGKDATCCTPANKSEVK